MNDVDGTDHNPLRIPRARRAAARSRQADDESTVAPFVASGPALASPVLGGGETRRIVAKDRLLRKADDWQARPIPFPRDEFVLVTVGDPGGPWTTMAYIDPDGRACNSYTCEPDPVFGPRGARITAWCKLPDPYRSQ